MKLHKVYVKYCHGAFIASYHFNDFSLVATGITEEDSLRRLLSKVQRVTAEVNLAQDDIIEKVRVRGRKYDV